MGSGGRAKREKRRTVKAAGRARQPKFQPGSDPFGFQREAKIVKSNVRNVFTPHQPISEANLLFGRTEQITKLVETLNTPGQHVLLFGERGVGKSSLANVASHFVLQVLQLRLYVKRCDRSDTFESIIQEPLIEVQPDLYESETSETESSGKRGGLRTGIVDAGGDRSQQVTRIYENRVSISPSTAGRALENSHGLLVIDEFDAIQSNSDKGKISELIKQLSDNRSPFKILVVGIAGSASELTAAHPSVQRNLRETKLRRMSDDELREVVTVGASAINVDFETGVVSAIARLSAGYPHFTHLLALKSAESAIGDGRKIVGDQDLEKALKLAVEDAEGTLKTVYDDSVRSNSSYMYGEILAAAASLDTEEFTAAALREAITKRTGEPISQGSLQNYFTRLMSSDHATILRRVGQGVYRFEDPRMRSYVRIVNKIF